MQNETSLIRRRWHQSDWFVIPFMLTLMFAARSSLADHYHVPTGSMEYTIMTGDRVLIDKTAYGLRIPFTDIEIAAGGEPQRGDVAVFDSPIDGTRLIKRIAAIGGDTVSIEGGLLAINGTRLAIEIEAQTAHEIFDEHEALLRLDAGGGPALAGVIIPEGFVLALGDNRGNSIDSRYFGLIEADAVYGRALGVYFRRGLGPTWRSL